jgi:predicted DCC family thiol-disulfide oxidoreductase YuxK
MTATGATIETASANEALPTPDVREPGVPPAGVPPLAVLPIDFGGPRPRIRDGRGDRLVVLYDRDCGLCTASARALDRWDRHDRLELVPLQDVQTSLSRPGLAAAVRGMPLWAALHVVDERTGAVHPGGDAVLAIASVLPGGWIVRPLRAIPPVRWIVGLGYRLVADHRHRIGRWLRLEGPVCEVPR